MPKRATDPPLYRRPRSPYWWTWVYEGKKRVRISTKCTDRRAALAAAAEIQRQTASPRDPHAEETVADALLAFLDEPVKRSPGTIKAYHLRASNLGDVIGSVRLAALTREHVEGYVMRRQAGVRTVRNELTVLNQAMRLAKTRGRSVPDVDLLSVPVPGTITPKERWLTRDEYAVVMDILRLRWSSWIRLAVYSGGRPEEVNAMLWDDVDLEAGVLHIRGTKTAGSDRYVPIAAPLLEWMRQQSHRKGHIVRPLRGSYHLLKTTCAKLGIPRFTPHDCRRTFSSWLLQDGVSERDIADLLGHRTVHLTRTVYAKTSMDRLRLAVSSLK